MSTRKVTALLVLAAALVGANALSINAARADVTWEHIGTLQTSMNPKKPLLQVKMYNTWTAQRHRLLLNYAVAPSIAGRAGEMRDSLPSMPSIPALAAMPSDGSVKPFGSIGFVQRLDDDRVIAYESQSQRFISEPRLALMKRLRFNPWKKLAPELANEAPPSLTDEQRTRLKAESGAILAPIRSRMAKTFFRALPGQKNFFGLIGNGYRLTQLLNVGGMHKNQSWIRVSTEWWIAPEDASDADINTFQAQTKKDRADLGGLTNSMWLNEYIALAAIPSDPILRAAWNSLQIPADAPAGAFRGTPLLVMTNITLPPLQRARFGDVLFTMRLSQRNTDPLANTVFDVPQGYKSYDIQPALKKLDPVLDGSAWISLWDYAFKNQ